MWNFFFASIPLSDDRDFNYKNSNQQLRLWDLIIYNSKYTRCSNYIYISSSSKIHVGSLFNYLKMFLIWKGIYASNIGIFNNRTIHSNILANGWCKCCNNFVKSHNRWRDRQRSYIYNSWKCCSKHTHTHISKYKFNF